MAVRKKTVESPGPGDRIDLARNLTRVREAIKTLPPDDKEHVMNQESANTEASTATSTPRAARKVVKKKAGAKKVVKKVAAAKTDQITLSEIAKSVKMEPRRARRILRGCDLKSIEVDGQRWTWKKGGAAHEKVVEVLKAADAE